MPSIQRAPKPHHFESVFAIQHSVSVFMFVFMFLSLSLSVPAHDYGIQRPVVRQYDHTFIMQNTQRAPKPHQFEFSFRNPLKRVRVRVRVPVPVPVSVPVRALTELTVFRGR